MRVEVKVILSICAVLLAVSVIKNKYMAPKYKLTYFNIKGRAEPIRYLLSYGGVDFEDIRIKDDWAKLKPLQPFGKVPVLEVDGKVVHQTIAICRYLAKQFKLAGKDDWEDLEIDMLVDTILDLNTNVMKYIFEADPKVKEELRQTLVNESLPFYYDRFEKQVKNGHLVGGKLTWGDIYFTVISESLKVHIKEDVITVNRPNLKAVMDNVYSLPAIKEWRQKHP